MINWDQIAAEIARSLPDTYRRGNCITVLADGDWSEQPSANTLIAKQSADGRRVYQLAVFRQPEAAEIIADALHYESECATALAGAEGEKWRGR